MTGGSVVAADVVVVGAGPGGASAAAFLAREGVDVALLDQAHFPRDKVCGDGLTAHAAAMLEEMGLAHLARRAYQATTAYIISPNGDCFACVSPRIGRVLGRAELDAALVDHAVACGARLFAGTKVVGMDGGEEGVVAQAEGGARFTAAWAVLGTGTGIQGLRAAGFGRPPAPTAAGRRAYFEGADLPPHTVVFAYERGLLPAYGWIFPLGDGRANVGVTTFLRRGRARGPSLSAVFEGFVTSSGVGKRYLSGARRLAPACSAPLRMGFAGRRLGAGRLLAVGDACAGANPLSGEGVHAALVTGKLAARSIMGALREGWSPSQALDDYRAAVAHRFDEPYRHATLTRRLIACPAVMNLIVRASRRHPELGDAMVRVFVEGGNPLALLSPGRLVKLLA